jgi:hypothetical protein
MALILCPDCRKKVSSQADVCVNCGYPIKDYVENADTLLFKSHTVCPKCNSLNDVGIYVCTKCKYSYKFSEYEVIYNSPYEEEFSGVYKYSFGEKYKVYCPRCKSANCKHYKQEVSGKSTFSINLNPLKPFTLFNENKKKSSYIDKFICNDCGKIFE